MTMQKIVDLNSCHLGRSGSALEYGRGFESCSGHFHSQKLSQLISNYLWIRLWQSEFPYLILAKSIKTFSSLSLLTVLGVGKTLEFLVFIFLYFRLVQNFINAFHGGKSDDQVSTPVKIGTEVVSFIFPSIDCKRIKNDRNMWVHRWGIDRVVIRGLRALGASK